MIAGHDRQMASPSIERGVDSRDVIPAGNGRRHITGLRRLLPFLRSCRWLTVGAFVSLTSAALISLALPLAMRRMIDHGFSRSDSDFVDRYFLMLGGLALALAIASACRYYFVAALGERIVSDLRLRVFRTITRLPASFFDANRSGEIASRLTADATQIKSAVSLTASVALRNSILCIGALAMIFITSPGLSAITVGTIPLIIAPLILSGQSVRRKSRRAQDTFANASAYAAEIITGSRTVQAFNGEEFACSKYELGVEASYSAAVSAARARAFLTAIAITFIFGSVIAVLWIGARNVLSGALSVGNLSQFLIYSIIAAGSLGSLSEVWGELAQAAGAADRLFELLDEKARNLDPGSFPPLVRPAKGAVEISGLHFAYPGSPEKEVLRGVSMRVLPGETVAIVGPSGSGKSTLFSLMLGFYNYDIGSITIDGRDLRTVTLENLRTQISIVPQDVTLFATSIGENIAFGRPDASQHEIAAAATKARADQFISKLPNEYETVIGERGLTLSGGQRQRIAIARAVLKNAPLLLLDEATASLDAESEALVQRGLEELMSNRTTIVIAHRLATILKADRILVMDQGRIIEEGTHASLIRQGGVYARLAELQFSAPPVSDATQDAA